MSISQPFVVLLSPIFQTYAMTCKYIAYKGGGGGGGGGGGYV